MAVPWQWAWLGVALTVAIPWEMLGDPGCAYSLGFCLSLYGYWDRRRGSEAYAVRGTLALTVVGSVRTHRSVQDKGLSMVTVLDSVLDGIGEVVTMGTALGPAERMLGPL